MRDLYFHKPIDEYVQSASLWHKDTSLGRFITLLPQIRLLTRLCYSFYEVSNPVLYPDELWHTLPFLLYDSTVSDSAYNEKGRFLKC
jgi:hypothetical protein